MAYEKKRVRATPEDALYERIIGIERRLAGLAEKLQAVDPAAWRELADRHTELADRFRLLIHQITVATELGYYARRGAFANDIPAAVLFALDLPPEWWIGTEELTLERWAERVLDAYHKRTDA